MLTNQIATFEKVSLEQFIKDMQNLNLGYDAKDSIDRMTELYSSIKIPSRATSGSVGYDFYLPFGIGLQPGETIVIPTGIRCKMLEGFSLDIYPKSGLGFKNFTTIANTIGIIDADYYYSDNEGHILVKIINKGFNVSLSTQNELRTAFATPLNRKRGESFVQGIFHECFAATNDVDNTDMKVRNGGFDSTK